MHCQTDSSISPFPVDELNNNHTHMVTTMKEHTKLIIDTLRSDLMIASNRMEECS